MKDRRIRKSKAAFKQALLVLMKTKPISQISVTELCALADLNRSTFYANYTDIHELLLELHTDLFDEMCTFLQPSWDRLPLAEPENRIQALQGIIEYLEKNKNTFQLLLSNNEENLFEKHMSSHFSKRYTLEKAPLEDQYLFLYHTIGSFTLIHQWIMDGCPCTSRKLAQIIAALSSSRNR